MTNPPLPEAGPEREIFLKALRVFSDGCKPPELISECPFSVDLSTGGRGCGEECLDLLDRYGVRGSTGGIPIGIPEVAAHPMGRPKRPKSHASSFKPFDAGESFYRDSDDPDRSTWETVSLLYSLRSSYLPSPNEVIDQRRLENLVAAADELRRRHFAVDELLRCGLRLHLAAGIGLATVIPGLIAAQPPQGHVDDASADIPELFAPPPAGWPELLDEYLAVRDPLPPGTDASSAAIHRMMASFSSEFSDRLQIWSGSAPIDDLMNWRPPSIDTFLDYDLEIEPEIKARCRQPQWVIDRFTTTYLKDWNTDSLKLEWRYQQGSVDPPCSQHELMARKIDINDLARTLAQAAASLASENISAIKFTAVRLLRSGRRGAAAAVFDAARQESWDDAEIQNDYGFCLLPDAPSDALKALEIAAKLGFTETVNICNRILALFKLSRHAAALEVAGQAIERWDELDVGQSCLWAFEASEPTLLMDVSPRSYLLHLAAYIAKKSGDELVAARWQALKSRLEPDPKP